MRLGKFYIAPGDRKRYVVNYTDWLDADEKLTNSTAVSNSPLFFVDGSLVSNDGKMLVFFVSGGDEGDTFEVMLTVYTDRQQIKNDTVTFEVTAKERNV